MGLLIGLMIISAVVSAITATANAVSQAIAQYPVETAVAVLLMFAVIGAAAYGGFHLWQLSQQARAAESQRQHEAYLAHISTLQGLQSLTPTQFEVTVGDLLRSWGYADVTHSGGPGDLAADLICRDAQGLITVVQCKRYATGKLISSPEVQKFIGMIYAHHRAHHGIFVTTSGFTEPSLKLAQQHNIRTIDGNQLVTLVQQWRFAVEHQKPTLSTH